MACARFIRNHALIPSYRWVVYLELGRFTLTFGWAKSS